MIKSLIIGTVILIMTWLVLRSNVAELKKLTDQTFEPLALRPSK